LVITIYHYPFGYVNTVIIKMARPLEKTRSELSRAVVELRKALGDSQQQFAGRLRIAMTTIARYETSRPPKGKALATMARVAEEIGRKDLADEFLLALNAELGPLSGAPLDKFPLEVSPREWVYMRLAQMIAQDEEFQHLRKPYLEFAAPVYRKLAKDADASKSEFFKLLHELEEVGKKLEVS
jgi:transcriptional regulator with XRE-family HTH domain